MIELGHDNKIIKEWNKEHLALFFNCGVKEEGVMYI